MSCACGMDTVGTCLVCGARLCAEHALRGGETSTLRFLIRERLGVSSRDAWDLYDDLRRETLPVSLSGVQPDFQRLLRYQAQRQALLANLERSGVICANCRVNSAIAAARAIQPTAPSLGTGGSKRLRDATASYLLGDIVAWKSMASDEALKNALFHDLIHLARETAERVQVPVEWEAKPHKYSGELLQGKVRVIEEVFHVVDVTTYISGWDGEPTSSSNPKYMNRSGQWRSFRRYTHPTTDTTPDKRYSYGLLPDSAVKLVTAKKAGWFSPEERVFCMSWSEEPPHPGLGDIMKRAAELLAPAA